MRKRRGSKKRYMTFSKDRSRPMLPILKTGYCKRCGINVNSVYNKSKGNDEYCGDCLSIII